MNFFKDSTPGRHFIIFGLGVVSLICGCRSLPEQAAVSPASKQQETRVNSYSLLHQLLAQERNVDKLLLIKLESPELKHLIKTVAATCSVGAKRLEEFARLDPSIRLDQFSLPPGETAARDAIASTTKKELLTPFNSHFELELLLTQSQALSYGWHLAKVAAANEPRAEFSQSLEALSSEMKGLHAQVVLLIQSRQRHPPK